MRGSLGEGVICILCEHSCRSQVLVIQHRARLSWVVAREWWEALMPGGGELRLPKTIPRGDIGL